MTYIDRLQPQIKLTSPSGLVFDAKWAGNNRTLEKELGVFKTPGLKGVIVQDQEVGAVQYPLTFFFDGPDNDLESSRFFNAAAEKGTWTVIHPVKGQKTLQLVSISEAIQPVSSGNVTQITCECIEVTEQAGARSAGQLAGLVFSLNSDLGEATATQINNVVSLDTADKVGKFRTAVEFTVSAFDNTLQGITNISAATQAQAESIKRGITSTIGEATIDVLSVAGQVRALIELPNLVVTDLKSKIDTYTRFSDNIFDSSPEASSPAEINTVAVQELAVVSAVGAVGVASVSTALFSRQNVIDNIEANLALFTDAVNGLDEVQELYTDELLSDSYFSQSESFSDSAALVGATVAYLIKSAFDLAVEKRFTLDEEENPVMIAMREYDGPGENDENIDLFYSSNELTGQETYLLPVGKEVVVYL